MKVIGIRPYSFQAQNTGETIDGVTIYVTTPFGPDQKNCEGEEAAKYSVSNRVLQQFGYVPQLGDDVYIGLNQYKRVNFIACRNAKG